jgi:hypothetical protein
MQANPASPARLLLPQVTELPVTVDLAADMDTAPDTVLVTEPPPPDMAMEDRLPVPCLLQVQDLYLRQDVL